MDTRGIKWCMENTGLKATRIMCCPSSMCYSDGKIDSETRVETFQVDAPDGSQFVVTITKLKDENA